jgi:putative ABC transport system permease protein
MIALRMAWGNLFLHKSKSLLLGTIMLLGIAVLFIGNSLIDTAIGGLRKMFVEGFTGELMVTGPTSFPVTIFGDTAGGEEVIPHISKYAEYESLLADDSRVAGILPLLSGQVAMGLGERRIGQGAAFGVDIETYRTFFSGNLELVQGAWPESDGSPWILLSETSAAMLSSSSVNSVGNAIVPGSRILLSALGETAGTVLREVEVKGILRFSQSNQDLAKISLVDADTMRDLSGFASLRDGAVALTQGQAEFVAGFDPEDLFSEGSIFDAEGAVFSEGAPDISIALNDAAAADKAESPDGAWQFILVKLAPGASASAMEKDLTGFAATLDEGDHVQDWVAGAGSVARTAVTIRLVFDLMVSIVAVIVIMITMSVLVVSVSERIPELGTLRALGARRRFIRKLILLETSLLALLSGALGLISGFLVLKGLARSGIAAPTLFFEALFAGPRLVPEISFGAAFRAFIWIFGMSILSALYPAAIALRIAPVVAMKGD